jgi:hypothetical protein
LDGGQLGKGAVTAGVAEAGPMAATPATTAVLKNWRRFISYY